MRVVDLFAGAGGFSQGARATGLTVVWAANHWQLAVDCHASNFPHTEHVCQDLTLYPSCEIPDHDILLASPSCKGFSPARGKDQAHHDRHRATAWVVIDVLEAKRPAFAVIENVPEMQSWILYPAWCQAAEALGYSLQELIVDAADCGVPQNRERLFVVMSCSRSPLEIALEKKPHVPVGSVLDWDAGRWSPIHKPRRSQHTIRRIEKARCDGMGPRFLIPYYSSGSGLTGRCLERPIGTLTTKARWALVDVERDGGVMRMLSIAEARRCMGFEDEYILPKTQEYANAVLGNAVCPPVAADVLAQIVANC